MNLPNRSSVIIAASLFLELAPWPITKKENECLKIALMSKTLLFKKYIDEKKYCLESTFMPNETTTKNIV